MADQNKRLLILLTSASVAALLAGCVSEKKFGSLDGEYQQLRGALGSDQAEIQQLDGNLKITFKNEFLYPEGGYRLSVRSDAVLAKLVPVVWGPQQTIVTVDGYTDNVPIGPEMGLQGLTSNLELSSKRADGVAEFLRKQGVRQDLLSAQGFGESNPVRSNSTPGGRAANRRIEVSLIGPGT